MSSGLGLGTSLTSSSIPMSTEILLFFWGLGIFPASFSSSFAPAAFPSSDISDASDSFSACVIRILYFQKKYFLKQSEVL